MRRRPAVVCLAAALAVAAPARAQLEPRVYAAAGMGVSWLSAPDVADLANQSSTGGERLSDFTTAVVFSGIVSVPLSADWALALDYGYIVATYSTPGFFGQNDFTVKVHAPTLVAQYTLVREKTYAVRAGAGAGYHIGILDQKLGTLENSFDAGGIGVLALLEAQTAFGEDFFGSILGEVRWDGLGELTNADGQRPGSASTGPPPELQFFSVGIRFGFAYHF
jgi:hypothetical protein